MGRMIMEYYAKSKQKILSSKEKEWLKHDFKNLILELNEKLTDPEKKALDNAITKIDVQNREDQKKLTAHLKDTVHCAEDFFEQYGMYFSEKEKKLIIVACGIHDLGKINLVFQKLVNPNMEQYLYDKKIRIPEYQIPHGFLSALSISKKEFFSISPEFNQSDFDILVTAVYYHHTRKDTFGISEIVEYCNTYYNEYVRDFMNQPHWKLQIANETKLLFRNTATDERNYIKNNIWNEYLLIKGMLNRFDWSVSAGYDKAEIEPDLKRKYLKSQIEGKIGDNLRPAQEYMRERKEDNLIVIAPTGSGKTEAALLWVNGEKSFYTLPLKVSSNAIYERIREEYNFKSAAILHSDSMSKYLEKAVRENQKYGYENYERARLLSAPLTVCTVDQLFKFVYKALGTEIFAATLKYSKIILDEVQAYSPRVVATLIYGLKTIQEMGGKFAIITATFPPVLQYFMKRCGLLEGKNFLVKDFSMSLDMKRHRISIRNGEMDIGEIVDYGKKQKVLVICNTVSKAQKIYKEISEMEDHVYLLHSRFIREDRDLLEKMIMDFSRQDGGAGIWITTQIVEASLDIDFDILFTEMCSADSLLQRMGRCNRAGRYAPEKPNIIIINNENGVGKTSIYEPEIYERSLEQLKVYEDIIFTEEMKSNYVNEVYKTEEVRDTNYYKQIERYLEHFSVIMPLEYKKEEADQQFRDIHSITVIPDSIYGKNQNIFENCIQFLQKHHIGREAKGILNSKLDSLTMSMNLYGKFPDGVDHDTIDGTHIYRASLKYEFDKVKGNGQGLILDNIDDENFIL